MHVATTVGVATELLADLKALDERFQVLLAGLTSSDGGQSWLQHRVGRLEAGEETAA